VLSSIRTVLSFGTMSYEIERYEEKLNTAEKMSRKKGLATGVFTAIMIGSFNASFGVAIYYAVYLITNDCQTYPPAEVVKSLLLMVTGSFALGQGMPILKELSEARSAAAAIFAIIEKKSQINVFDRANKKTIGEFRGDVEFNEVWFSYPKRAETSVLKGISLKVPQGRTVAICGRSGCGKSTLVQLLERFYEPSAGSISVDGCDVRDLDLGWLREQMAVVSAVL
jgi:ATP-binding cassette, subfamily B (MDR/TAP), member 1